VPIHCAEASSTDDACTSKVTSRRAPADNCSSTIGANRTSGRAENAPLSPSSSTSSSPASNGVPSGSPNFHALSNFPEAAGSSVVTCGRPRTTRTDREVLLATGATPFPSWVMTSRTLASAAVLATDEFPAASDCVSCEAAGETSHAITSHAIVGAAAAGAPTFHRFLFALITRRSRPTTDTHQALDVRLRRNPRQVNLSMKSTAPAAMLGWCTKVLSPNPVNAFSATVRARPSDSNRHARRASGSSPLKRARVPPLFGAAGPLLEEQSNKHATGLAFVRPYGMLLISTSVNTSVSPMPVSAIELLRPSVHTG
jgi:hypothetical protein